VRSQPGTQEVGVSHSCTAISRSVTGLASLTYRIRLIGFRVGVADLAGMEVRRAVALRGPRWAGSHIRCRPLWPGFRTMCRPAGGLAVAWLIRGASARSCAYGPTWRAQV
jgi:hypothetical protein